jgi:hypothetical protein
LLIRALWAGSTILEVEDDALLRIHAAGFARGKRGWRHRRANADEALQLMEARDDVRLLFHRHSDAWLVRRGWTSRDRCSSLDPHPLAGLR